MPRASVFKPLSRDLKVAVAVVFAWMALLSAGVTVVLIKEHGESVSAAERQSDSAKSRVKTVGQRCELTGLVLAEARNPERRAKLRASKAGCEAQLVKVRSEAGIKGAS